MFTTTAPAPAIANTNWTFLQHLDTETLIASFRRYAEHSVRPLSFNAEDRAQESANARHCADRYAAELERRLS